MDVKGPKLIKAFLFNKTNRHTILFWLKMNLYMFRAVPLFIIRSSITAPLAMVYVTRFEVSLRAGPGWNKPYDIYHCQVYSYRNPDDGQRN
jgi:hypothetical protein